MSLSFSEVMLPVDAGEALLAGRLLLDDGPTPVLIRRGQVEDVSRHAPTISHLLEVDDWSAVGGELLFPLERLNELPQRAFLAPFDLQVIKAAGVTFAISAI